MSRMSATSYIRLTALLAVTFSFALARAADDSAELNQVRQKVGEMFDMIEPDDVKGSPVDGWYTIQKGSVVAYISADGRYLLQGDMIDLDHQVNLSEAARTDARRELMSDVADERTIIFSPKDVKYSVSIFTDVECSYCRRLHSQIDEYMAHGIQVRYLLYPRNGPASRAWNTAEEVWCASDRANALTMAKLDRKFETSSCDSSIVQDHYVIGRDVGLSGTPAIVFDDGTLIGGYLAPDQLAAALEENAAK
ncbi:MAG: DsbC family protein [Gammaproteobacteria bacterium]|nr:DsbC family protein [Gammaproteobacteria bacterium]MDH3751814.1 DsbC family protein [Gammaproteobacteria bacterium]MDH3804418.1 DsbC family protein [Gammaproteobacteria bacterium]